MVANYLPTRRHIPDESNLQSRRLEEINNTSQQEFGTRKVYCVSNVSFHAQSKYAIKIFPSPTVFVQWPF